GSQGSRRPRLPSCRRGLKRVKSRHRFGQFPLYPQKQTLVECSRMSALCGGLKRSTQHFISDARDGVDSDGSKICSGFQRGGQGGGVVEPLAARIRSSTE